MGRGKKKYKISMGSIVQLDHAIYLIVDETINMIEGLDNDDDDEFLNANTNLVPMYLVDLQSIMEKNLPPATAHSVEFETDDSTVADGLFTNEDIVANEYEFEQKLRKVTRVQEDALDTVFLEAYGAFKPVKISTLLEEEFKNALIWLLTEYIDIFAWKYYEMIHDLISITFISKKMLSLPRCIGTE